MKITTNLGPESLRYIGLTGFDVITLIGFNLPSQPFKEPVIKNCASHDGGKTFITDLESHKGVTATKSKATIYGTRICGKPSYILRFGNQGSAPFMNLTIYSRMKHRDDNIENMTVGDVWKMLDFIVSDIKNKHDITLRYDRDNLRVKHAEINRTFPLQTEYHRYIRILNLMSHVLSQKKKTNSKPTQGEFSKFRKDKTIPETNYLLKGSTIEVVAYNKTADVASGHPLGLDSDFPLMRVEIKCDEQILGQTNSEKDTKVRLIDLTDEKINSFYKNYFSRVFNQIEKHLKHFLKTTKVSEIYSFTFEKALEIALQSGGVGYAERLLLSIYLAEATTKIPQLLDIDTYIRFFVNDLDIRNDIKKLFIANLEDIRDHPEKYDPGVRNFIKQRYLYYLLKINLTEDNQYTIMYSHGYGNTPITVFLSKNMKRYIIRTFIHSEEKYYQTRNKDFLLFYIDECDEPDSLKFVFLSPDKYSQKCDEEKEWINDLMREEAAREDYNKSIEYYEIEASKKSFDINDPNLFP